MNPLVVTTCCITVAVGEFGGSLKSVKGKPSLQWAPSFRPIVAGFVLGLFLMAIDAAAPELTGKLCTLIIVTDAVLHGKPILDFLATL